MNKIIIILTLIATSLTVNARLNADSPLDEIRNSYQHRVIAPLIPGGVFNVCASGDKFYTINPVKECVATKQVVDKNDRPSEARVYNECVKYETKQRVYDASRSVSFCAKMNKPYSPRQSSFCEEYGTKVVPYKLSHKISVQEEFSSREGFVHSFYIDYTIPYCQDLPEGDIPEGKK